MNKYISGAYGFEVALSATNKKIYLPEISILRNKRIKHIDFCSSSDMPKTPNGNDIISNLENMFFTFTEEKTKLQLIDSLPARFLDPRYYGGISGSRLFINKIIDLPKSFIDVSTVPAEDLVGKYIYLVFYFDEPTNWGIVPRIGRTAILPLELTLGNYKTYFPENQDLKNKKYQNLYISFPQKTSTGKDGLDTVYSKNKFLTLSKNNQEFFYRVPLYLFNQSLFIYTLQLQNIQIDLQSSYIETLTVTANDLKTVFFNAIIDDNK